MVERTLASALCVVVMLGPIDAAVAEAQARGRTPSRGGSSGSSQGYTTSGSTRRVGSSSGSRRSERGEGGGRDGDVGSASADGGRVRERPRGEPAWHRRTFHRIAVDDPLYLAGGYDCVRIHDGICEYPEDVYIGHRRVGFGLSIGGAGTLYDGDTHAFEDARGHGRPIAAGRFGLAGVDLRAMAVINRLRVGGVISGGGTIHPSRQGVDHGAYEEGSALAEGWYWGLSPFVAYAPQLGPHVQLWLAGRIGFQFESLYVTSRGRRYSSLTRTTFSVGPELGVRVSADDVGVRLYVFADLVQYGNVTAAVAFTWEFPTPAGEAF